jgi:hypothetical protein
MAWRVEDAHKLTGSPMLCIFCVVTSPSSKLIERVKKGLHGQRRALSTCNAIRQQSHEEGFKGFSLENPFFFLVPP